MFLKSDYINIIQSRLQSKENYWEKDWYYITMKISSHEGVWTKQPFQSACSKIWQAETSKQIYHCSQGL